MKINVTAQDIAEGTRHSVGSCALALAVKRAFKGARSVDATTSFFRVFFDDYERSSESYSLPKDVGIFVAEFDAGAEVEPFSFVLDETMKRPY